MGKYVKKMIPHLPDSVKNVLADGAYDQGGVYQELHKKDIKSIIPQERTQNLKILMRLPGIRIGTKHYKKYQQMTTKQKVARRGSNHQAIIRVL